MYDPFELELIALGLKQLKIFVSSFVLDQDFLFSFDDKVEELEKLVIKLLESEKKKNGND